MKRTTQFAGSILCSLLILSGCAPTSAFVSSIGARSLHAEGNATLTDIDINFRLKDSPRSMSVGHSGPIPYFLDTDEKEGEELGEFSINSASLASQTKSTSEITLPHNGEPIAFSVRESSFNGLRTVRLEHHYRRWYGYPAQGLMLISLPLDAALDLVLIGGALVAAPIIYTVRSINNRDVKVRPSLPQVDSAPPSTSQSDQPTPAPAIPVESVAVYLVPVGTFPPQLANELAKRLSEELKINVRTTYLPIKVKDIVQISAGSQYVAEDLNQRTFEYASSLPHTTNKTLTIALTYYDIVERETPQQFVFSQGNLPNHTAVISTARLATAVPYEQTKLRAYKLAKRAVAEQYFGSPYAPITSLEDLDTIGLDP